MSELPNFQTAVISYFIVHAGKWYGYQPHTLIFRHFNCKFSIWVHFMWHYSPGNEWHEQSFIGYSTFHVSEFMKSDISDCWQKHILWVTPAVHNMWTNFGLIASSHSWAVSPMIHTDEQQSIQLPTEYMALRLNVTAHSLAQHYMALWPWPLTPKLGSTSCDSNLNSDHFILK